MCNVFVGPPPGQGGGQGGHPGGAGGFGGFNFKFNDPSKYY